MTDKEKRDASERLIAFLSRQYHYKPVPFTMETGDVRAKFQNLLPDWCKANDEDVVLLVTQCGTTIACGYNRIVVGDYGAFVEILPEQICKSKIRVKPGQEYRLNNPQYANCKYDWLTATDESGIKIYRQRRRVDYADYVPDRYYVSPYEVKPIRVAAGLWATTDAPFEALKQMPLKNGMDASVFLHGICGVFALALCDRFGYSIEAVAENEDEGECLSREDRIVHIYCRHKGLYIDVRGAIGSKKEFLLEFEDFFDSPECFSLSKEKLEEFLRASMSGQELSALKKEADELMSERISAYDLQNATA